MCTIQFISMQSTSVFFVMSVFTSKVSDDCRSEGLLQRIPYARIYVVTRCVTMLKSVCNNMYFIIENIWDNIGI